MWCGQEHDLFVLSFSECSFSISAGIWDKTTDYLSGGASKITIADNPNYTCNNENDIEDMLTKCDGVCGTYSLKKHGTVDHPYAGVYFLISGEGNDYTPRVTDVSDYNGICVVYTADSDISLEMNFDKETNKNLGNDFPRVTLPKTSTPVMKEFKWSEFTQSGSSDLKISGDEAAKKLTALNFLFRSDAEISGAFNITSIGRYGSCTRIKDLDSLAKLPKNPFKTWHGSRDFYIKTGYDNGSNTSGRWYSYQDDFEEGHSTTIWPVDPPYDNFEEDSFFAWGEYLIEICRGICGEYHLDKGSLVDQEPFVGIGVNMAGKISDPESKSYSFDAVDATSMGGFCVSYTSDIDIDFELGLGEEIDKKLDYALPAVHLPKTDTAVTIYASWADFKQPADYSGSKKVSGEEAAKALASFKFKMQGKHGSVGKFNIMSIGPYYGNPCYP